MWPLPPHTLQTTALLQSRAKWPGWRQLRHTSEGSTAWAAAAAREKGTIMG